MFLNHISHIIDFKHLQLVRPDVIGVTMTTQRFMITCCVTNASLDVPVPLTCESVTVGNKTCIAVRTE